MLKTKGLLSQGIAFFTFAVILVCLWNFTIGAFNSLDLAAFLSLNLNQQRFYSSKIPNNKNDNTNKLNSSLSQKDEMHHVRMLSNLNPGAPLHTIFYRRLVGGGGVNYLERTKYMYISRAILKYGMSNFSLAIIEYCEPEQCLDREDFYISGPPPTGPTPRSWMVGGRGLWSLGIIY